MKLQKTSICNSVDTVRIEIRFLFQGQVETVWFETKDEDLAVGDVGSSFLTFAILPAMLVGEDIDLSGFALSKKLESSIEKMQNLYAEWFEELELQKVKIFNYHLRQSRDTSQNFIIAAFFSGGVDSFDTILNIDKHAQNKKIEKLLYVYGYDVRLGDDDLYEEVKKNLDDSAGGLCKDIAYISTNLREFTEKLISWDFIHGAALIAVAHIFNKSISTIYIPASNSFNQLTPNGSHPELDFLFASEDLEVIHYGTERKRIEKINKNIAQSPIALRHLRICWKNSGVYWSGKFRQV